MTYVIDEKKCPPCAGQLRPERLADHVVQQSFHCPLCHKQWVYRIRIELQVAKRMPMWRYVTRKP